jgi:hypothetical protein
MDVIMNDRFTLFAAAVLQDEEIQVVLKADQLRLFTGSRDPVDSGSDYTLHKTFTVKSVSRESTKWRC